MWTTLFGRPIQSRTATGAAFDRHRLAGVHNSPQEREWAHEGTPVPGYAQSFAGCTASGSCKEASPDRHRLAAAGPEHTGGDRGDGHVNRPG